jgi:ubiquinone/menaquinone biosynthesis C-methylase UbiE
MKLEKENWDEKWQKDRGYIKLWEKSYSWKRVKEEILKRIKKKNELKVFEFGCGGGLWLRWFKEEYNAKIFGIDNSKIGLEMAKKIIPKAILKFGDVRKVPFKKEIFDLVFCLGLIVHFNDKDIQKILSEMYRVTKKGGNVIVTTPNRSKQSLLRLYKNIFGAGKRERDIGANQIRDFLENAGFKDIEIIPVGLFIPKLRNKKWFSKLNPKFLENFITSDNIVAFARK